MKSLMRTVYVNLVIVFIASLSSIGAAQAQFKIPPPPPGIGPVYGPGDIPGGVPRNLPSGAMPNAMPGFVPGVAPGPAPGPPTGYNPLPPLAMPPYKQGADFTDYLVLRKGLHITFPITNGLDSRWQVVGDYDFITDIDYNDRRGYRFEWHMTPPAGVSGLRAVEPEDAVDASNVSLFYPAGEANALVGFTSIVRVSDRLYHSLKNGDTVRFSTDGPDSPMVLKQESKPVAHEIHPEGTETINIEVDGMRVPVRAIRATTDVGWSYSILDNPNFPIMLAGTGPFQWSDLKFNYEPNLLPPAGTGSPGKSKKSNLGANDNKKAQREIDNMIKQLKDKGQATTHLILFDFDSDKLKPISEKILDGLAQYLKENDSIRLQVEGHTCTIGGKDYNLRLSKRRSQSVKRYLVNHGISASRLTPEGFGFAKPIATNKTNAGRAKNRRVVFKELN